MDKQSRLQVDERQKSPTSGWFKQKSPTGEQTTKVYSCMVWKKITYGWRDDQSHLWMDDLNKSRLQVDEQPKSPTGGWSKQSCLRVDSLNKSRLQVDRRLKSPTGGRSKQCRLQVDRRPKLPKQSRLRVDRQPKSPMGGRSKQKSPTGGRTTIVAYGWTV